MICPRIGSHRLRELYPDFKREPKDLDLVIHSSLKLPPKGKGLDAGHIPPLDKIIEKGRQLSADEMYTLKASHLFWDIKWEKHIYDIQFMQDRGAILDTPLFYELYEYWVKKHGEPRRSKLNMSAKEFFTNGLKGGYDHDLLHTLINPNPTFNKVLKDGEEVDVSEEKFNSLSFEEKCDLVSEEIYVMAYERMAGRSELAAYRWMLKQFIMYHAPIWEAKFIIENYNVLKRPIIQYKSLLDKALNA